MAKDTFWFPHDYEPTSDPKIIALIGEHGATGYGIYWRVVEMLHSDESHKLPKKPYIYTAIAKQLQADLKQIQAVLEYATKVCELFMEDDDFFWCERAIRNVERKEDNLEAKREAGRLGGIKSAKIRKNKEYQSGTPQAVLDHTSTTPQALSSIESIESIKKIDINNNEHHHEISKEDWDDEKKKFTTLSQHWETYLRNNVGYTESKLDARRIEYMKDMENRGTLKTCKEMYNHFANWNKDDVKSIGKKHRTYN